MSILSTVILEKRKKNAGEATPSPASSIKPQTRLAAAIQSKKAGRGIPSVMAPPAALESYNAHKSMVRQPVNPSIVGDDSWRKSNDVSDFDYSGNDLALDNTTDYNRLAELKIAADRETERNKYAVAALGGGGKSTSAKTAYETYLAEHTIPSEQKKVYTSEDSLVYQMLKDRAEAEKRQQSLPGTQRVQGLDPSQMGSLSGFADAFKSVTGTPAQDAFDDFRRRNIDYNSYLNAADFEEYSKKGAEIQNPTFEEAQGGANIFGWRPGAADVGNIVTFSRDNLDKIEERMVSDDRSQFIGNALYGEMTEDQVKIYNYILAKEGKEAAQIYLDSIAETLNEEYGKKVAATVESTRGTALHPIMVAGTATSAGLDQYIGGVKQAFNEYEQPTSGIQYAGQAVREDQGAIGKFAYDAISTLSNMAPSILASYVAMGLGVPAKAAEWVAAGSIGLGSGGNAYKQALAEGRSRDEAKNVAVLTGASEAVLSKLLSGISAVGGLAPKKLLPKVAAIEKGIWRVAAAAGIKLGGEISEEVMQLYLEPLYKTLIYGDQYDAPTVEEVAYTALLTLVTTGLVEGGEIAKYRTKEGAAEAVRAELQEDAQSVPVGVSDDSNAPGGDKPGNTPAAAETGQERSVPPTVPEQGDFVETVMRYNREQQAAAQAQQDEKNAAETQRNVSEENVETNSKLGAVMDPEGMRAALNEDLENGRITETEYDEAMESIMELESLDDYGSGSLDTYNPDMMRKVEVNTDGRSSISDDGSQRAESQSAGEQAGTLAEGTGRYQSRQVQSQRAAGRRDDVSRYYESRGQQPVSARDYLGTGKVNKVSTVQEMPAEMVTNDAELNRIAEEIRTMGLTPHFYVGDARLRNGNSVDGLIRGKDVYIRADGAVWTATQNWDHEKAHAILRQSPGIEARLYGEIVGRGEAARRKLHQTMQRYREAYHGIYDMDENGNEIWDDTVQEMILQEILADAYAGKDTFAQGVEEYADVSSNAVSQIEKRGGEVRGPPEKRMSVNNIQPIQAIGRKSINQFTSADITATKELAERYWSEMGVKSPFFRAWFGDWRVNDQTPIEIANKSGAVRGSTTNKDTGWNINISGKVFNETRMHTGPSNVNARQYLTHINDIVEKAVLIDSYGVGVGKTKSENTLLMHSLYAVADIGNGAELLKLYVEEMNDPNSSQTGKRAYQLQNIENQQLSAKGSGASPSPVISTADIKTIADMYSAVKARDPNFKPNSPGTVVSANGMPMIVYHGTNEDFRIFKSKNGTYWFSESEDYAESMAEEKGGNRIIPAFLNIRNPYRAKLAPGQFSDPTFEGPIIRAAKAANCDGVIIEADTDNPLVQDTFYVVFDQKNIKSADGNIGTFDSNDADIYFSTGTTDQTSGTSNPVEAMPAKARRIMERAEKKLQRSLSDVLNLPKKMPEGVLESISREISNEFLETGTVSDETIDRTFEQVYSAIESEVERQHGVDAEDYRQWAERDYIAEVAKHLAELRLVKRYAAEKAQQAARDEADTIMTLEELGKTYQDLKAARRGADKAVARNLLTESDERKVHALLRGDIDLDMLKPETDNVRGITEVYNAKLEYEKVARRIRRWNATRKGELRALADKLLESASDWTDKGAGWLYSRETMERNIRDIVPDKKVAQEVIDTLFKPVHDGAAAATKMKNEYRDRVRKLDLSRKVAKGNEISEAAAVQLLGEAEDNIRHLEQNRFLKERDGKSLEDWRGIVRDMWEQNPNLDAAKIRKAVKEFREIYDELFEQMNTVRMRNGYEPVNYRKGYFPHFQSKEGDGILGQFGKALGVNTAALQLPTTINGITHTFKPGMQWFGSAQQRMGVNTAFDAVEGFDSYIEGVADVINQTDNIQRLRAFAAQVRYRTSEEGIRKQVDAIQNDPTIAPEDKQNRIEKLYAEGKFELGNLAVELDEYTNLLAGKKSRHDRDMEQKLGRGMYAIMKGLEGRVAANMVAINPGSWLTNFIPITQGAATLDTGSLLSGMWDTLRMGRAGRDEFALSSSFLTNRRGSDPLVKMYEQGLEPTEQWKKALRSANVALQRRGEILSTPMELIDSFTADTLVRARYNENVRRGLSEAEAMADADAWAAGVMADRSKGAMPTLFSQTNPLTKLLTQFQLEVNNQLSYVFKDVPREMREKGVAALALALFKFMLGAYLYNELYEKLIGRRPALDPVGMLKETVEDVRTDGAYDAGLNLAVGVAEELPFIGSLLGGGRLPISSAIPDFGKLWQAISDSDWDSKKRVATAAKELAKPATYLALPFGGGQVKKVVEGVSAIAREGSYSVDRTGADILQYPVYANTPGEAGAAAVRALFFGKSSLPTAQEWVNSGFDSLGARQTEVYQSLIDADVNSKTAYDTIREWESINANEAMTSYARGLMQRGLITGLDVSDRQKLTIYSKLSGSNADTRVEKFGRMMDRGLSWREIMLAFNKQQELNNDDTVAKASDKAAKFAEYVLSTMTVEKALVAIEEMKFYVTMASAPSQESLEKALNRTNLSSREKRTVWYDYCDLYGWKAPSPW